MKTAHCQTCGQLREFRHLHDRPHGVPGAHMAGSERFECTACGETYTAGDGAPFPLKFVLDVPADQPALGEELTDEQLVAIAEAQVDALNEAKRWLEHSPYPSSVSRSMVEARTAALRTAVKLLARHGYAVLFTGKAAGEPATIAEG